MPQRTLAIGLLLAVLAVLAAGLRGDLPAAPVASAADESAARAAEILAATGVRGGFVVHMGCGDGRLTAALRSTPAYVVQGLDADPGRVEAARRHVTGLGLYGPVTIDRLAGERLPYVENLVNLLVVETAQNISREEMLRVLAPKGIACVKQGSAWTKLTKPAVADTDEWNQYLHDASNNAVAHDAQVGPPRHLQWTAGPAWSRHHDHMASMSAMVSAGGRVFYIMDEGPRDAILLPAEWTLIARDAFNGTILWKRAIDEWNTHLWPLKSGPNQLPRRLVAVGDRVYATLGIDAPLTALDAATGQTLATYAGTEHTDEVITADGVLYLLVAHAPNKWKDYRPKDTFVWANTRRANAEWAWDEAPRTVMAVRADSGEVLWKSESRVAPLTLAAAGERVFFYDGEKVAALERNSGKEAWRSEAVPRKQPFPTGYGPTLVVQEGVVLLSVENKSMTAFDAADGRTLWTSPHHRGGHASPDDLLVIGGLVWSGAVANGADTGIFTGRDIKTGQVKSEFPPDVNPDWFHHRCYRSRATDKYFIASRTGIEFIDLAAEHWDINHWVRGGCLYGFMPSYGMLYVPPQSCGCFLESKLFGLNALASAATSRSVPREVPDEGRLERGPAYSEPLGAPGAAAAEWPTYRHDALRSGAAATEVPVELRRAWQVEIGGRLSSPVMAAGRVYVAAIDAHKVHALDAETGKTAWTFTAGGRIDSPPTIDRGRVLFGAADGWVYALRAADGALAWRYRAAPLDRRVLAYEQPESAWPVSGSVMVAEGAVYCVAGRSAFLDGGMRLVRLDPATGRKLSETVIDHLDPATGENLQAKIQGQDMPVALPDILSCDGQSVYMRSQAFDLAGAPREVAPVKLAFAPRRRGLPETERTDVGNHLFSRSGFLDDSWFFRSYWTYGKAVQSNYGGWLQPGHFAPAGRLMAFNADGVYGFDRKPEYLCNASVQEYYLYGADREVSSDAVARVQAAANRINAAGTEKNAASSDWALRKKFPLTDQSAANYRWANGAPPIQARGLVLAGNILFAAGPPDLVDEEEAFWNPDSPDIKAKLQAQAEALVGKHGGQLLAVSASDGGLLAAYDLGAMPRFNGLIAARGRLYMTTIDGRVLCLGDEGETLAKVDGAKLAPLDTSVKPAPAEPPAREQSTSALQPAGDFAHVAGAEAFKSDLGYRLSNTGKKLGVALKKLPAPATGVVELKTRLKVSAAGTQNGFLVFGAGPADAELVKCGLRFKMAKAVIIEGPTTGGKTTEGPFQPSGDTVEITVRVDLAAGEVTMETAGGTVRAKLNRPPKAIEYVGYGVLGATSDFSKVEVVLESK